MINAASRTAASAVVTLTSTRRRNACSGVGSNFNFGTGSGTAGTAGLDSSLTGFPFTASLRWAWNAALESAFFGGFWRRRFGFRRALAHGQQLARLGERGGC